MEVFGNRKKVLVGKEYDMAIIRTISGYQTSKDYALLWELARASSIVCVVDYGEGLRDVAQTICNGVCTHISARGICYVDGFSAAEFCRNCERANVEFLIPNTGSHHPSDPEANEGSVR